MLGTRGVPSIMTFVSASLTKTEWALAEKMLRAFTGATFSPSLRCAVIAGVSSPRPI